MSLLRAMMAGVLLLLGLPANAQNGPVSAISVVPVPGADGGTAALSISGEWDNSCTPEVDDLRLEDHGPVRGLVLLSSFSAEQACVKSPTEFQQLIDLAAFDIQAQASGIVPLSVYLRPRGEQAARLVAFDLVQLGEPGSTRPETGLWWPEPGGDFETSGPGVGFALEVQGQQAVLMTNTYGDQGQSRWLLSTGDLKGQILRSELTELGDGQTLFGEFKAPTVASNYGRAMLAFHSASRATLWLVAETEGAELIVQPMSLVRFSFGQRSMLSGTWMLLPESGGEATRLDLTEIESAGGSITLLDGSGTTVTCQQLGQRKLSPPQTCRMRGIENIQFYDIGLDRWRGTDSNGLNYVAVRLDP